MPLHALERIADVRQRRESTRQLRVSVLERFVLAQRP